MNFFRFKSIIAGLGEKKFQKKNLNGNEVGWGCVGQACLWLRVEAGVAPAAARIRTSRPRPALARRIHYALINTLSFPPRGEAGGQSRRWDFIESKWEEKLALRSSRRA